jgi:hypothetical protein
MSLSEGHRKVSTIVDLDRSMYIPRVVNSPRLALIAKRTCSLLVASVVSTVTRLPCLEPLYRPSCHLSSKQQILGQQLVAAC